MTKRSLAVVMLAATTAMAQPKKSPPPAAPTIDAVIKQSKTEHKALIVEFYTEWCKPCHIFEQTTLLDKRVKAAIGTVLFVRYDAEAEPGLAAAGRYHVSSYPTFLAIDKDGVARRTFTGIETDEAGVKQFLGIVSEAELATLDESDVKARVKAKANDPTTRLAAGRWYAERGMTTDALGHLDAVAANTSASAEQRALAGATGDRMRRIAQWKQQLVAEKLAHARKSPATIDAHELAIATVDSGAAPADVRDVFAKVFAVQTEPSVVNGLVYVAIAAGAKDEALAAAEKYIAPTGDPTMMDTLAECYYVKGDRKNALRVEDEAIAKLKSNQLAANRARFDKGKGDAPEVDKLHADAAKLWKRLEHVEDESPGKADEGPSNGPEAAMMQVFMTAGKLGTSVGKTCAVDAGSSDAAFAQVTLDAAGKVAGSVLYLDANASPKLRACLTAELAKASFPVVAGVKPPPIDIRFKPESTH
jgi:thioredoxin-like negative regulator of GroEL